MSCRSTRAVGRRLRAGAPPPRSTRSPSTPSRCATPGPSTAASAAVSSVTRSASPSTTAARCRRSTRTRARTRSAGSASSGAPSPQADSARTSRRVGVDTTHARVGELWRIGDVVLRVEVPRIPCATFAAHMGEPHWVRRFTDAGRTGAYLSVVTPGVVHAGAAIAVERPDHDVDLLLLFRGLLRRPRCGAPGRRRRTWSTPTSARASPKRSRDAAAEPPRSVAGLGTQ